MNILYIIYRVDTGYMKQVYYIEMKHPAITGNVFKNNIELLAVLATYYDYKK